MRKYLIGLLASVFVLVGVAQTSFAVSSGALAIRHNFSSHVTASTYTELVASTVKGVKGMSLVNTGNQVVKIGFGPAGSEVGQLIVPNSSTMTPVYYPISAGYATRVSVISLDDTSSTGSLIMNLIYN